MVKQVENVADCFRYKGTFSGIEKLGNGHINSTYLVLTSTNKYVLQQINTVVFPKVEQLMSNMLKVTNHIAKKHFTSSLVMAKDGKYFTKFEDKYYRMYDLVDGTCIESAKTPKEMYLTGLGFGLFQMEMSDFNDQLYEVIPDFHNTVKRYEAFEKAIKEDRANRMEISLTIIRQMRYYKKYCSIIVDKIAEGVIPVRVTHNDTKINNLILDEQRCKPLSVIDLDTVMEGSLLYDFGDAVRSGCNSAAEDEEDTSQIYCKLDFFRALCRGFFVHTKNILTEEEKELLVVSGIILTYECALRFLTDYLNGDIYFKVSKPNHNLIRAKSQLALMKDMIKNISSLENIVKQELGEHSLTLRNVENYLNLADCVTGEIKDDSYFAFKQNKEKVFFYFKCERMYNKSKHTTYNAPLYEGDIVELMLTLGCDNHYLEIEVNQYNAQYQVIIDNADGKGEITISYLPESVAESSVKILDNNWAMYEISIEKEKLKALGMTENLKFNAHRQIFDDEGNLHLRSLNPTYSRTFHDTDAFIRVNFEKGDML
jgi:Ser/Thr protein kinase RdoA (MazF antagonist)